MLAQPRGLIPFGLERRRDWNYLLDVEFATDAGAPLTSYDGEVSAVLFDDSAGAYSTSGGVLVPSSANVASGDPGIYSRSAYGWKGGRAVIARLKVVTSPGSGTYNNGAGFSTGNFLNNANDWGIRTASSSGKWTAVNDGVIATPDGYALDTWYRVAVVLRPGVGYFAFVDGSLLWVSTKAVGGDVRAVVSAAQSGGNPFAIDYLRLLDVPAPFTSDYGIALLHTASVSGSDYTATADVICDLVVTAPASLAGTAGLRIRKASDDYWQVNFDNLGRLRLQRYAAGVAQGSAVNLANSVISGSASLTLRVIATGSNMDFYTLSGTTWTKRGAQQTDGVLNANTGVMPFADSSWLSGGGSVGQMDAYPRSDASYSIL